MKPPEQIYPQRKAAEFDEAGRPHHFLFYTGKPHFFQLMHDCVSKIMECNKFEDRMVRQQKTVDPALQINLAGSSWLGQDKLELMLVETIDKAEYENFVNALDRLANHPYSYRHKDFIGKYRRQLSSSKSIEDIPKPDIDEKGRNVVTTYGKLIDFILCGLFKFSDTYFKLQIASGKEPKEM